MPASTRPHRTLAVLVHCLGVLTALPAMWTPEPPRAETAPVVVPTSPPAAPATAYPTQPTAPPATYPAAPATPPSTASPAASPHAVAATPSRTPRSAGPSGSARAPAGRAQTAAPKIRVHVTPADTPAPAYRIEVRNDGSAPVQTTVRQELPAGASAATVTGGGRTTRPAGRSQPAEVTWQLTVPARSTTTLNTTLDAPPDQPLTAPACAYARDGDRPYDCATATWEQTAGQDGQAASSPAWRTPALVAGAALVPVLAGTGWWLHRRRRGRNDPVAAAVASERGTLYPRPAVPAPAYRRRRPPLWLVVGGAAVVLVGTLGTVAATATSRVAAIDTDTQPTSGAWHGQGSTGALGVPLREAAFEFTVYRMACTGSTDRRRCQATVGVRNLTSQQQSWHGELQRAYLPDGRWVNADELATRSANQGRDVFAEPVAAHQRMVVPLIFTVAGPEPPHQVELRSGVFSAGVRVDVP